MQEQEYLDLAHALLLLSRSARSVTQVAQDCGFVDVSHLIRVFKTTHGITPEVWRRVQGRLMVEFDAAEPIHV